MKTIFRWPYSLHNPPNNDLKMAMPHRKSIRFHKDNEITLKESIKSWAQTMSCVARIRMWARIDQVWSFFIESQYCPSYFCISIKCLLYVSLSVENICENLSKNNIEKEISQNVNLSSFFDKIFWICNFCHLCILTSASFFWWIVFWG